MSAFRFEAVDAQGRLQQGLLDADSARAARDRLRADGLTPTAIDAAPARAPALQRTRLAAGSLALLTRQLASLVQSGMPLEQALVAVSEQSDEAAAAKLVLAIRTHVLAGESLQAALSRFPRTFTPLYRGLIAAGTETGRLSEVLARLADYLDARLALRQKFVVALIYPVLVTVIAVGVIAVLVTYVVPQVVSVYQQSRQTLPLLTQALIATSGFFRATGGLWLTALGAAVVAFAVARRRERSRARIDAMLLRMPGIGRLAAGLDTARYASTLAILV
ncbi:MAG TPA: type II secretion system F family protein, partial [Casimicrobiaceae bacterium]|nr:type II secretion system F family protein [Casimicrobiaceae bacterium]